MAIEEIITKMFKFDANINLNIQRSQLTQSRLNSNESKPRYSMTKQFNKPSENLLNSYREVLHHIQVIINKIILHMILAKRRKDS